MPVNYAPLVRVVQTTANVSAITHLTCVVHLCPVCRHLVDQTLASGPGIFVSHAMREAMVALSLWDGVDVHIPRCIATVLQVICQRIFVLCLFKLSVVQVLTRLNTHSRLPHVGIVARVALDPHTLVPIETRCTDATAPGGTEDVLVVWPL